MSEKILIIDCGSQYTQLIARRVRELNVYCEIHSFEISLASILKYKPKGIIISGGPDSVYGNSNLNNLGKIFTLEIPVLGICFGMQLIAKFFGGEVQESKTREFGYAEVRLRGHSNLFTGIEDRKNNDGNAFLDVWMSHGDSVVKLPDKFKVIASNKDTPLAGIALEEKKIYGLQFHPEVTHTKKGKLIIKKFISNICDIKQSWFISNFLNQSISEIKKTIKNEKVILGLSGGVDSSVLALLLHKSIGNQLISVFVNTGMLRKNESNQVINLFKKTFGLTLVYVDATNIFLSALKGITDPEEKRKIIGREFINIFQKEAKKIKGAKWLAQGTIYPDVIESAGKNSKHAKKIKSHHNVGGLPDKLNLKLLEPLSFLFKDEVRKLGMSLNMPRDLVYRHPFPGPGLGVRVLGEVRSEYLELLREADYIFIEEIKKAGKYETISQAFVVFIPMKSVGVMGDHRTYEYIVALRAIETSDFMTAKWSNLGYELLSKVSNRIINEVKGINRVVYDVSGKPPSTIEWE